ncbi:MAG: hypothetical protein V4710_24630 [Verrucomicrobiota bacterium]
MSGTTLYWIVQIAIWIVCIRIFVFAKQRPINRSNSRREGPIEKMAILVLIPVMAFGYACLGGYPPKDDQIYFIFGCSLLMYGVMIARWIRNNREDNRNSNDN